MKKFFIDGLKYFILIFLCTCPLLFERQPENGKPCFQAAFGLDFICRFAQHHRFGVLRHPLRGKFAQALGECAVVVQNVFLDVGDFCELFGSQRCAQFGVFGEGVDHFAVFPAPVAHGVAQQLVADAPCDADNFALHGGGASRWRHECVPAVGVLVPQGVACENNRGDGYGLRLFAHGFGGDAEHFAQAAQGGVAFGGVGDFKAFHVFVVMVAQPCHLIALLFGDGHACLQIEFGAGNHVGNSVGERSAVQQAVKWGLPAPVFGGEVGTVRQQQFDESGHWTDSATPQTWASPEDTIRQQEFMHTMEYCLEHLPDNTARVFMLRELMGLEVAEICQQTGISADNCYTILYRARNGLRRCLQSNWLNG